MTTTNQQDFILGVLNASCGDSVKEKVLNAMGTNLNTAQIHNLPAVTLEVPGLLQKVVTNYDTTDPAKRDCTGLPDSHSQFRIPDWEGGAISSFIASRMLGVPGSYFTALASEYRHLFRYCKTKRFFYFARVDVEKFRESEQYPVFKRLCDELVWRRGAEDKKVMCSHGTIIDKLSSTSLDWARIKGGYRGHPKPAI